jgi:hypothetical protein
MFKILQMDPGERQQKSANRTVQRGNALPRTRLAPIYLRQNPKPQTLKS